MKKLFVILALAVFVLAFVGGTILAKPNEICWLDHCVYANGGYYWVICCEKFTPHGSKITCELSTKVCPQ